MLMLFAALTACMAVSLPRMVVRVRKLEDAGVRILILLAWLYSILPAGVGLFLDGRQEINVSRAAARPGIAGQVETLLTYAILGWALLLIVTRPRSRATIGPSWLLAFMLPWVCLHVVSAVMAGNVVANGALVYPLVAAAVWVCSPSLRVFETVAWLTLTTAAVSVGMGLTTALGIYYVPGLTGDKALFSAGQLLAGPYEHSNALGMAMALGSPSLLLIRSRTFRLGGFILVALTLAWSAGRTSMMAAAAMVFTYLLIYGRSSQAQARIVGLALSVGVFLIAWLPLHTTDPLAYTYRGQIWIAGLHRWTVAPVFGSGPNYYLAASQFANDMGQYAYHGHNLFVHFLVTGGLTTVTAVFIYVIAATRRVVNLAGAGTVIPALFLIGFVFESTLEFVTDFGNLGQMGYVSWLLLAVVFFTCDGRSMKLADHQTNHAKGVGESVRDPQLVPAQPVLVVARRQQGRELFPGRFDQA